MRKLLSTLFVLSFFSCREIDNSKFTHDEMTYIDSIFKIRAKESKIKMDSLCIATHDENLKHLVDSIKVEYVKEIEAIID